MGKVFVLAITLLVFPGIEFIPEFSWTGTFASTEDGLPFIGNYKKMANSFFALGLAEMGLLSARCR